MKVILSRKGMDSKSGGMANPILPDGTLLSLPIPDKTVGTAYKDLSYKGQSFEEIIRQLRPKFDFSKNPKCHLDPDIYEDIKGRTAKKDEWKPAFGQHGVSAIHLDKFNVGEGDIFLFYGMFQKTMYQSDKTLCFDRNAPIIHIIYGYMKVGEILRKKQEIEHYSWHPHGVNSDRPNNRLYLPDTYGTFQYDDSLMLTKSGQDNRRLWALPAFFGEDGISISWQGDNCPMLKDGYAELNSACRGQEFVVTASTPKQERNLCEWVDRLIQNR